MRRASSGRVGRRRASPGASIWWTTSSSRCSRTARSPGRTTARSDCEVNTLANYPLSGPSPATVSANTLFACNARPPLRHLDTARAAARRARRDGGRAVARRRALHPRPGGRGLRGASSPPTSARSHAIGVANGTDALTIALRALGVGPGRRGRRAVVHVLRHRPRRSRRPARGRCSATSTRRRSASPPETVRAALTPRTKAVIVVHLFGNVAPVARDRGARRAGARGRRAGRRLARPPAAPRRARSGTIATFSLLPVEEPRRVRRRRRDHDRATTTLAERVRMLRFHGSRDKVRRSSTSGYNSRLDELQAAILRVQLPHLDAWCDGRRAGRAPLRGRRASASSSRCRGRSPARAPRGTSTSSATERADELAARARGAPAIGSKRLLPRARRTASRRCASTRRAAPSCRAPTRPRARTSRSR